MTASPVNGRTRSSAITANVSKPVSLLTATKLDFMNRKASNEARSNSRENSSLPYDNRFASANHHGVKTAAHFEPKSHVKVSEITSLFTS